MKSLIFGEILALAAIALTMWTHGGDIQQAAEYLL